MDQVDQDTPEKKDISKRTVALLIIVAIILSVSLTITALRIDYQLDRNIYPAPATAKISLTVVPPPIEGGEEINDIEENKVE